jgi:hypothetical protein
MMQRLIRRLRSSCVALVMLVSAAPVLQAMPIYIFPIHVGGYAWKDLDGKCVAGCSHLYTCPCWPINIDGFWIP